MLNGPERKKTSDVLKDITFLVKKREIPVKGYTYSIWSTCYNLKFTWRKEPFHSHEILTSPNKATKTVFLGVTLLPEAVPLIS